MWVFVLNNGLFKPNLKVNIIWTAYIVAMVASCIVGFKLFAMVRFGIFHCFSVW